MIVHQTKLGFMTDVHAEVDPLCLMSNSRHSMTLQIKHHLNIFSIKFLGGHSDLLSVMNEKPFFLISHLITSSVDSMSSFQQEARVPLPGGVNHEAKQECPTLVMESPTRLSEDTQSLFIRTPRVERKGA